MISTDKRVKMAGAAAAAVLLVVVGVVALNTNQATAVSPLEHAEAIARAENSNMPMSQLPDEWQVVTPQGWEIDSDEPVVGAQAEDVPDDAPLTEESEPIDDDIDSPVMVETNNAGEQIVAEMDGDVVVDDEDEEEELLEGMEVAEDKKKGKKGKKALKCKSRRLKKCRFRKRCGRACNRVCKRVSRRVCQNRKFCRCFCKYVGNKKARVKCVTYKRKTCKPVSKFLCKRRCKKWCKQEKRCYCCKGPRQVRQQCRKSCRRILIKTKCGKCRCRKLKCYKTCIMICR